MPGHGRALGSSAQSGLISPSDARTKRLTVAVFSTGRPLIDQLHSDIERTSGSDRTFQMLEICQLHVCSLPYIATTLRSALVASRFPILPFAIAQIKVNKDWYRQF